MAYNGRYYDWEHITIKLPSGTVVDVDSVDFSDKQKVNRKRGKGRRTRGFTKGGIEGSGTIKLAREEYDLLMASADVQKKGLYGLDPFPITISYDKGDGKAITDELQDCIYTERKFSDIKVDTEGPMVELSFEILGDIVSDGSAPIPV
jgi:hypothetical protein